MLLVVSQTNVCQIPHYTCLIYSGGYDRIDSVVLQVPSA